MAFFGTILDSAKHISVRSAMTQVDGNTIIASRLISEGPDFARTFQEKSPSFRKFESQSILFVAEALFISTGVETFERKTLLGIMPLWLPLLWGYIFLAMRRAIMAIESYFS